MKEINQYKYLHFRKVSVYFYLTSFFLITLVFIIYLYANKNNRSCQYGSTLFCSTDTKYPLNFENDINAAYQIEFLKYNPTIPSGGLEKTIQFPYVNDDENNDFYDINYYFGISGGNTVKIINSDTGVCFRGAQGASIYFKTIPDNNFDLQLKNTTEFVLENANPKFTIIMSVEGDNYLEYYYINSDTDTPVDVTPTNIDNFYSSKTIKINSSDPLNSNWVNLLNNLQDQKKFGCSSGNQAACGCADPSFTTTISCNDYHLNKETGFYCPSENPGCSTLCTVNSTAEDNCGYTFCNTNGITNEKTNHTGLYTTKGGTYQNSYIDGLKQKNNSTYYKLGIDGPQLIDNLKGFDSTNFVADGNIDSNNSLTAYPSFQLTNFCGGTAATTNNYDNKNISSGTSLLKNNDTNYDPRLSQHPIFSLGNQFNF